MKNYYQAKCTNSFAEDGYSFLCASEQKLKKEDCIVVEAGGEVTLAYITKTVDKLEALTCGATIHEIIQFVDLTVYKQQRDGRLQKAILMEQLEEKVRDVKLMETFKKYSEKDPEMRAMMEMFMDIDKERTTPIVDKLSEQ